MNPNTKSTADASHTAPEASDYVFPGVLATFHKGVERAFQAQKATLDLAVQQTTIAMQPWKQALKSSDNAAGLAAFDLAGQTMQKFVAAQNSMMDLMLEQTVTVCDAAQEQGESGQKSATGLVDVFQQSLERGIAAQKSVLDFASQQTKLTADAVKKQPGAPAAAVDSIQRGVDSLIGAQKELLDIAVKPAKTAKPKA